MTRRILSRNELESMRVQDRQARTANSSVTEARRVAQKSGQSLITQNARHDLYADLFTNGSIVQYPHGNVMMHGRKPNYYRGQIKDFGSCRASLYRRILEMDAPMQKAEVFVNQLRLMEFNRLISQLKQVREWPFGDVFTYAIAQHYGFETDVIDITDDLEVALFFACCKHIGDNQYRPLSQKDIDHSENDRYGVLFIRDEMANWDDIINGNLTVMPIGYQPFTRCHKQKGHCVPAVSIDYDLQTDSRFEMCLFEHSVALSKEIHHIFNGGKDLFLNDALNGLQDQILNIKAANSFSNESFSYVCETQVDDLAENEWLEIIGTTMNVSIGECPWNLTRQRRRAIDRAWSVEKFVDNERIAPGSRMIKKPDA